MSGSLPSPLRSALLLGVVALGGAGLLAGVDALTAERIAAQKERAILRQLNQLVPAEAYDNALHQDTLEVREPEYFNTPRPVRVYRARRDGEPVAAILDLVAPDGYNGDIELLVGVRRDGTVLGVRVVEHRETPGLGDDIEVEKSDWVRAFEGRSLADPGPEGWAVRKDGGVFDQFTGATVTPRAVVRAVERALRYFESHRAELFAEPPPEPQA